MAQSLNVSEEAVELAQDIVRDFAEQLEEVFSALEKGFSRVEDEGWSDNNFKALRDAVEEIQAKKKDIVAIVESEMQPKIINVLSAIRSIK